MLSNKVVVVTGGAGLLGRSFVRGIAERGGTAVVADSDWESAARIAAELVAVHGVRVLAAQLDITDSVSVTKVIADVVGRCGHVEAVVNCAYPRNAAYGRGVEDVRYEDFCENVSWHLGGYFLVMQQFARHFRKHGGGNIVNVASIYATLPPRFEIYEGTPLTMPVEYAAIKSGVLQLTRYFAKCYVRDGIRVNCLSPGGIFDNQPRSLVERYTAHAGTKGMLSPSDIVGSLAFLLSDESRYVTGQNLVVDDGFTL